MKKSFLSIFTVFFCSLTVLIHAAEVYMLDGKVYRDASELRRVNSFYVFKIGRRNYSVNINRIKKIIDQSDKMIFENIELKVEILKQKNSPDKYLFLKNKEKLGTGVWASNGEFDITSGNLVDGEYKQYYDTGKLHRTFKFQDNELNGWCKVYYKSGKVEREGFFQDNKEQGISKIFYDTGVLKGKSNYLHGEKNGFTTLYYKSGNIKAKMNLKNNQPDGLQIMYYRSGAVETEVYFHDGVKNGPVKQYYESGKIKMQGQLDDGKLEGLVTTFYESGRVKKEVSFHKGRIFKAR